MRKALVAILAILLPGVPEFSASTPEPLEHLGRMSGCFEVTYRFVEDGVHDMFSAKWKLDDEPVTEWVGFERDAEGAVVLPHVTVTPTGNAVAHWYEVWQQQSVESGWTQEVWSHSPGHEDRKLRYRCTAPWKGNTWSCHAGRAPKPFRDDGAPFGFDRTDYEWLDRSNTLIVTPAGWVQQEHNRKMDASGEAVSHEFGWIVYRRIDEEACAGATDR